MRISSDAMMVVGALGVAAFLAAQGSRQEWTASRSSNPEMVRFGIERRWPGTHWVSKSDRPLADFQGLNLNASGPVKFEYVQDAGTLLCEGRFFLGRGSGKFQIQPNPRFVTALKALGYDAPSEDQVYRMLFNPVSLEYARGMRDMGLHLSIGELIELHDHGITVAFVRGVQEAGFTNPSIGELNELKNHGVTADFLGALREAGYRDIPISEVTELKNHGVDPRYLRDLANYGVKPAARTVVEFKDHGVQPEFLRAAKELGYDFTPNEVINMKNHGVDERYLRNLRDSGIRTLTADQIVKLKTHGVE